MDALSDVITVTRTGRSRSAHVRWHAPWRQRFASVPGSAGFQVVLEDSCWLLSPDAEPVQLGTGDVVFLPQGGGHTLADSPETAETAPACGPGDRRLSGRYASDSVDPSGEEGPVAVVLCGAYQLDLSRAYPLLLALPDRIHLAAPADRHPQLRSALELLAAEVENPRLGTDSVVPALLDALLIHIPRIWFDGQSTLAQTTGWAAALDDPAVTAALHARYQRGGQGAACFRLCAAGRTRSLRAGDEKVGARGQRGELRGVLVVDTDPGPFT
ncbi:cupin domain-containing protein [Streptomyces bobili]|uniref:cupin domain-containing protein n=1 Tax=Streptomyces bobili TaxID=67280 RepID=UPI00343E5611